MCIISIFTIFYTIHFFTILQYYPESNSLLLLIPLQTLPHITKEDILNNVSSAFVHILKVKGIQIFQSPKRAYKIIHTNLNFIHAEIKSYHWSTHVYVETRSNILTFHCILIWASNYFAVCVQYSSCLFAHGSECLTLWSIAVSYLIYAHL